MSCQNTGRLACPCATSYLGFRVANADSIGRLNVSVADSVCASGCDYGIEYGLNLCAAHDSGMPPFCNVPGAPAWCSSPWCYVNASHCALDHAESSYLEGEGGLHYSYATCSAPDSFTDWYLARTGTLQLCSVFAEADGGGPCGTARTHLQIEAMVGAINELNGGAGFSLRSGLITRTYRFNYTYHTYPAGSWATHGRNLSRATFGSDRCDVVVGMTSGCPDDEIAAQALVANETRRIYVTGRDPRVLTAGGAEQPYLFSTYVDSDHSARAALERYQKLGASSSALLYEDNGDPFYVGLGRQAIEDARALAYDVRYNASLRRRADGAVDYAALTAHLTAAHGTAPDVLVLTVPEPLFRFALERLKSWRPPDAPNAHVYSGVWWSGVALGNETCAGLAEECEHVTGAAQMASDEALRGYADALLEDTAYATYEQLRAARMPASSSGGGGDGGQLVEQPDAAAIPSLLAQALIKLFRFRDMPKPDKPLSDPLDYELLRSYLRSGERIAITYIGPVSFDARGQNVGRPPTLLQVSGGHAQPVLSQSAAQSAVSGAQLDYPAPAAECPADSHRLDYDGSCLLCSASTCEESAPPAIWLISIATGVGGAGLLLVLVGFCFLRRRLRRLAVRFGLSPYRLAKLVGWRYLLPAVFQRWWLRRHHLDAHTQLRKAAKEAERPDEQFRAELRGDAELRALFDRVASPATGLVGMQDWLRFCSADQAEADLEKARTQFLLAVREAHLTAMAAESSGKSHTSMATPPGPRRVIEAARAAAGMARDSVGKASGLSKRRSCGSTLPAVSGGVCGPGGGDEGATLNHEQFALLLLRSENRAACPRLLGEEHDASRPLSHYWIAASHNTYITGHQLTSEADAGMYSRLLLCGCRSLEVDIVDGMDGPVVTHHYTLVTRIQLKKVLHAIADAAFITSDLPVHLSLDVRASPKQQARAAELIVEVLGSALVLPEERLADGAPLAAACPHLLRRRILCKGKTVAGRELAARICGDCRRSEDRFTVSSAQESRRTVSTLTTTLRESDNEDGWALPRASEERDSRTSFPSGSTARVSFPSGILGESSADPTQSFRPSTLSSGSGRLGSETSTAAALGRIVIRTHAMALQRVEAAHALVREAFFLERPREGRDSGELLTVTSASELHFSHAAEAKLSDALGVIMPPPGRKQSTSHRSRSSISPGRLFGRKAPRSTTSGSSDLPSSDGSQRLARAKRLSEEEWRVAMQERTVRRIVRVFPKGTRTKSDNFDPMPCWAAGAQMAALNLQTNDLPSQLHHALFELNGGRGYVLKPAEMLGEPGGGVAPNWPPPRVVLHVATLRPISLFGLPPRGIDRPDVFGGGGSLHTHVPSLSVAVGKRRMRAPRGEDELPSLAVELHAIGGFSCVSLTLPPATARTRQLVSAKGGGGGEAVRYGGEVHCVAAERQQTVLRVAVLDEEEEAAYETCVLGVLREGYRVLHMRSTRGTRIRNCFLLCHISFTTQVNAWVGESEMMAYVRSKEKEMEEKVDEAAAEVAKLKTGKVVSHLKAMVGSHGAFESATRGGEQLEQLAAANKETSGWTEESVEQSV